MKKIYFLFLLTILPLLASADPVAINGIYYNLVKKTKTAEVTSNPNKYEKKVTIPKTVTYEDVKYKVTSIGNNAFEMCSGLTSVTIPSSVTVIGNAAFKDCSGLTTITIPNSVTSIGGSAFYGCSGLTSVTIPNSVTSIGQMAFAYCRSLTSVTIPNSVTVIYQMAFCECTGLTSVHITDLSAWCKINFSTPDSNPLTFAHHLFSNGSEIKQVVIPSDMTEIGPYTFCGGSSLTSVTIPNGVTSIGEYTFNDCSSLSSVTIPNSVTDIGRVAFNGCSKLSSLIIGTGIRAIHDYTFSGCSVLTDVYCYAENVPSTYYSFQNSNIENATLHVPAGSLEAYKAADPWSQFGSKVKITSKVKLNKTEVEIERGKTVTLKATVTPSTLLDKSVTWKSSNTKVATVTSSGKVKGIKGGTATITCTSKVSGAKATCKVTVINGTVTLNKTETYLEKGKTMTLKATLTPTDLDDKSVTWTSSDTKIATVSSSGKVKGVKYGTATITCTSNATGVSATCKVTVGKVVISMSEFSIKKSRAITLEAAVYPSTLADRSVVWESSDSKIATVSSSGRVKGVKAGTATITCTSVATGLSAICTVTVLSTSETRSTGGDDDGTTAIKNMEDKSAVIEPFDVYGLSGRKVLTKVTSLDGLPNGIYIVNGKKVLKK